MSNVRRTSTSHGFAARGRRSIAAHVLPLFALFVLFAPVAARAQSPTPAAIDALFAKWNRANSPGCSLGVVQNERFVYKRSYGSENLDYQLPISDTSVFYLASVSKQFAAAAIQLAVRQGKLSLDDDVRKWIPELPDYGTRITVRDLVHHTSGIRDYFGLFTLVGHRREDVLTDEYLLSLITRQKKLNFAPGSEWSYSNSGYVLLSFIIKRATGQSLREFSDQYMFRPLGMTQTHFHDEPLHPLRNRAIAYERAGSTFEIDHLWYYDKVGDGGLYSSVRDLAKWDANFYHDKIGGAGFIDSLTTSGVLTNGKKTGYGFGLFMGEYRGLRMVEHSGGLMGFRTEIMRFPDQRFTVLILCNVGEANTGELAHKVTELYLGSRMKPAAKPEAAEPSGIDTTARVSQSASELARYAGTYHSDEEDVSYHVRVDGDHLVLDIPLMKALPLRSPERDLFVALPPTFYPIQLRFARDAGGGVTGMRLSAGPMTDIEFAKQP